MTAWLLLREGNYISLLTYIFLYISAYAGLFDDIHEEACGRFVRLPNSLSLYLKLENCQSTGSFKIRGVAAQLDAAQRILSKGGQRDIKDLKLITMSAGINVKCFISYTSRD